MVALLTPIKGVPYLLNALHRIKKKRHDFFLDVVGDGPNKKEYITLADNLGLNHIVRFHGLKPKEEIAQFMRNSAFFVLPSLWENLPCVLIEAMATGTPIIATDVGGVKEMISEDVGLLVPSKDMEALEKGIEYMLDNYLNYSSKKISHYANTKFSVDAVSKQLDAIYKECLLN